MGSKLRDNLSNRYYQRRNLLNARPNLVKALVEDGSDISIWERMLKKACPQKQFDVKPYQAGENRTKSKQLVIKTIIENGGPLYVGCVDSDLDKLLETERYGQQGGLFYPSHYLFHTYVYSVENLFCLPSTLGDAYTTATSFKGGLDFEELFKLISQTVYPLMITDLYLRHAGSPDVFNVENWGHIFPGEKNVKQTLSGKAKNDIVESIANNVNKYLRGLRQLPAFDEGMCRAYEKELLDKYPFMSQDNCMLFVYGHGVFDFVMTLMEEQKQYDFNTEKQEIFTAKDMEQPVKNQRIEELTNRQNDIKTVLRSNFDFMTNGCQAYYFIKLDIQQAFREEVAE